MLKGFSTVITEADGGDKTGHNLIGTGRRTLCRRSTYHHLIFGHPAVSGEVLQHGHQELQAAVPVTQQQHHTNQVEDPHHRTGQVIGHMEDLERDNKTRRGV